MLQVLPVTTLVILCESVVLIKTDKWRKVNARLMCWQGLNFTLKFTKVKDPDHSIEAISITASVVVEGPESEGDKRFVIKLQNGRKTVDMGSESVSVINAWVDIVKGLVSVKRDPNRCGDFTAFSECIQESIKIFNKDGSEDGKLKQKLEDLKNISGAFKNDEQKILNLVKIELTKLRPTNWLDKLFNTKNVLNNLESNVQEYRDKFAFELLTSEYSYVYYLTVLVHVFKNTTKKYQKEIALEDKEFDVLFSNLESLLLIHGDLLDTLVESFIQWDVNSTVLSDPLKRVTSAVDTYKQYAVQFDNANIVLLELSKKSLTKNFFETLEEDPLCKNLTLPAYLIMPVQRIPRYVILINGIIENTHTEHTDYKNLIEVYESLKSMADQINLTLQKREDIDNTKKIIKQFDKVKLWRLTKPGRIYLHQGELTKQSTSGKISNNYYFLFSDVLVSVTKIPHNQKWVVLSKHVWETLTVEDDSETPLAFKINTDKSTVHFLAPNEDDKAAWMSAFSKVGITDENIAFDLAPLRLAATKECLICLRSFTQLRKRVYCRNCRWVICRSCCKSKLCDNCMDVCDIKISGLGEDNLYDDVDSDDEYLDELDEFESKDYNHSKFKSHLKSISLPFKANDKENSVSFDKDILVKTRSRSNLMKTPDPLKTSRGNVLQAQPENTNTANVAPLPLVLTTNSRSNTKELAFYKKLISTIYQNDAEMSRYKGTPIPAAGVSIWNMLNSSDQTIILSKPYLDELISAIQISAKKTKLTCVAVSCYWVCVVCSLCTLLSESSDPMFKQISDRFNNLFFNIYTFMIEQFKTETNSYLISIFIEAEKEKPKKSGDLADLISIISKYTTCLRNYNAPKAFINSLLKIFLAHINRVVFNYLLSSKFACTAANGFNIKLKLSLLQEWLDTNNIAKSSIQRLQRLMEAATLISLDREIVGSDGTIVISACPNLSVGQIRQLIENTRFDTSYGQPNPTLFDWLKHLANSSVIEVSTSIGEYLPNQNRPVGKIFPIHWNESIISVIMN